MHRTQTATRADMSLSGLIARPLQPTPLRHARAIVLALSVLFAAGQCIAAEPWITFTNCQHVVTKHDDGDSFRVRCGTNEFNVRLYFVDAPETDMRYPERNREQAEHFRIPIDDIVKAGMKARDFTRQALREPFTVRTRHATAGGAG